ncbi:hypothetical protein K1T71_010373 [Dendrolimus kikuchii]|uniref:Uncharacterized protein n=1 Tax=Dendrolimus kikuchii TaxID=765133 RepID=A0ACC1CRL1_9NEOP|nr:hypothetical protein K1T71_010373 [Dendrolimus kikuchii]
MGIDKKVVYKEYWYSFHYVFIYKNLCYISAKNMAFKIACLILMAFAVCNGLPHGGFRFSVLDSGSQSDLGHGEPSSHSAHAQDGPGNQGSLGHDGPGSHSDVGQGQVVSDMEVMETKAVSTMVDQAESSQVDIADLDKVAMEVKLGLGMV